MEYLELVKGSKLKQQEKLKLNKLKLKKPKLKELELAFEDKYYRFLYLFIY